MDAAKKSSPVDDLNQIRLWFGTLAPRLIAASLNMEASQRKVEEVAFWLEALADEVQR